METGCVYLLDHQLGDALTIPLVIEPNTVDPHYKTDGQTYASNNETSSNNAQNNVIIMCATSIPALANDWLTSSYKIYIKYHVGTKVKADKKQ